jgi:hypothetical protein
MKVYCVKSVTGEIDKIGNCGIVLSFILLSKMSGSCSSSQFKVFNTVELLLDAYQETVDKSYLCGMLMRKKNSGKVGFDFHLLLTQTYS